MNRERVLRVQYLKQDKKGAGIIEMVILVAIIAIMAIAVLPDVTGNVVEKSEASIDRLDEVGDTF